MTPFYSIGRHTVVRSVSWLRIKRALFSTKFMYSNSVPKDLTRLTLVPLFRQILIPVCNNVTCIVQVKYVHEGAGIESDSELEEAAEEGIDLYNESETFSFRNILYPISEDPLIKQLNASTSVQDVFNFIKGYKCELDGQLVSQAVIILWDLQKIFYKVNVLNLYQNQVLSSLLNPYDILNNYINEVSGHPDFGMLLHLVSQWNEDMSVDALTATILYLNKMGVDVHHPVMQKLIDRCEYMLESCGPRFPLTALSRFTVAVNSGRGLWRVLVSKMTLPRILTESCNSAEEFRLLTICLVNICQLVSNSVLNAYKSKADSLVERGIITAQDSKVITKAVRFLNYPQWSDQNGASTQRLLLVLKGSICGISPKDLVALHKVFQTHLEPADIVDEMHDAATQFLSQVEDERISSNPLAFQVTTDLLSCLVSFSSPTQKLALEKLAQRHVEGCTPSSLPTLFKILRQLKTSNVKLCDAFWSRTLQCMENIPEEREDYKLFRVTHRYMHFNNNLGGTYRHYELERRLIHWLWHEVENGTAGVMPSKFARVASFILAYGNIGQARSTVSESTLTQMVCKVDDMAPQFNKTDCVYISRGLHIGTTFGCQRKGISSRLLSVFTNVDTAMNNCALQHLKEEVLSLSDINKITKAYINRRGTCDTQLFEHLIKRHENFSGAVSSRGLRDVSANLLAMNCLVPGTVDQLVNYVVENGDHILGDTVVKLLYVCYCLGYTPTQTNSFFSVASGIILRDKERLQGLILIQAAIAFCFFHHLPEDLVHFIFTVDFLERLDEEVLNCYAKASYPVRVRYTMMHLNRAVCLDYPETDIPWFHEKYCQQTAALESPKSSPFHDDVRQILISVMGSEQYVQVNRYSPYFYRLDFQVLLNKDKVPVTLRHQGDSNITRIAILLWGEDAYTNGVTQLRGKQQVKRRHLEMLGYRVIGISSSVWNSMYMAEPTAKTDYLRQKIWPPSQDGFVQHHYKKS
ncbi:FAST kinase domain-containing protein 1, mitochondrial isoform X2 [Zootermopsis nevadensis]|uniref:FAST kinase domain-containing protein 1, mitochondrial isoform X2 n=1 Tax=Zootermopsis nevadensis TaxID=136037 RepID=UPI000B8ED10E|nr:FAST kinase domain-containing protein 1, mitochondrial isoform X2 [Zootermopsis nevadensis]